MTSLAATIRDRARERGAHPFVEDARSARHVTYAELADRAGCWAALLDARRVPPGGAVLLDVDDPLAFTVAYLGVLAAGRCCVPVDPDAPAADLARTARSTRPLLCVTDRGTRTE
ncbi:MAG: AMP-binding protein, partial [Trebonia sp.]